MATVSTMCSIWEETLLIKTAAFKGNNKLHTGEYFLDLRLHFSCCYFCKQYGKFPTILPSYKTCAHLGQWGNQSMVAR